MSFQDDLNRFSEKTFFKTKEAFTETALLCLESIQTGSAITGAPGQPIDTGALRASWNLSYLGDGNVATIETNVEYAPYIEDGFNSRGPFTLRSTVGGFHSAKMTVAGFQRIVDYVARKLA